MVHVKIKLWLGLLVAVSLVSGCAIADKQAAFDLENQSTATKDEKGFPRIVGKQYDRETPLPRNIERKKLEQELTITAAQHQAQGRGVDPAANKRESDRLLNIARTHAEKARTEIDEACETDADGIVSCKTE